MEKEVAELGEKEAKWLAEGRVVGAKERLC